MATNIHTHTHTCTMEWHVCSSLYYYLSSLQESRKLVEDTLLGVKGVISFTFNMPQKRCILRVRTDMRPEVPCRALDATRELTVKHVIKNENGEEVCVIILLLAVPTLGWCVNRCLYVQVLLSYDPSPEAPVQDEKENTKPAKVYIYQSLL